MKGIHESFIHHEEHEGHEESGNKVLSLCPFALLHALHGSMHLNWYFNRLRKMGPTEIAKRLGENAAIFYSRFKYRDPQQWPYHRFADDNTRLILRPMPAIRLDRDWQRWQSYNFTFDLTRPLDWFFSDIQGRQWPVCHYSRINYRPGNPHGDVRINWELSRLQFLPALAVADEQLARRILIDWLDKYPYLHGPAYLASMEVALRWFPIYWAVCLFQGPIDERLRRTLAGFAVTSGRFIESRLSTHSSAGNHLIMEAIGLFWLGRALEGSRSGGRWLELGRKILWEQILRQISPDGSNKEQSFWYLGFVLDGVLHYLLLEDREQIPQVVLQRIEKMLEFTHALTLPDGTFPDYGDRDDGFAFRPWCTYACSPFAGLLNVGAFFFKRPEWYHNGKQAEEHLAFWSGQRAGDFKGAKDDNRPQDLPASPFLKTFPDGGMTLMGWGEGRLLFRHAPLGLENTFGHGHADALAVLFYYKNRPVLTDLGSGQYNGDQQVRDFFRATIAHNTVELGEENQAKILGPFMWEKSYKVSLESAAVSPEFSVAASHDGYQEKFATTHHRKIRWLTPDQLEIIDTFRGPGNVAMRGAFHLGPGCRVSRHEQEVVAEFEDFVFVLKFPPDLTISMFYGSTHSFMGWRSTVYGKWEPIHAVIFSGRLGRDEGYVIGFKIREK